MRRNLQYLSISHVRLIYVFPSSWLHNWLEYLIIGNLEGENSAWELSLLTIENASGLPGEGQDSEVPVNLAWLPNTTAALLLRIHSLDAAIFYDPNAAPGRESLQVTQSHLDFRDRF